MMISYKLLMPLAIVAIVGIQKCDAARTRNRVLQHWQQIARDVQQFDTTGSSGLDQIPFQSGALGTNPRQVFASKLSRPNNVWNAIRGILNMNTGQNNEINGHNFPKFLMNSSQHDTIPQSPPSRTTIQNSAEVTDVLTILDKLDSVYVSTDSVYDSMEQFDFDYFERKQFLESKEDEKSREEEISNQLLKKIFGNQNIGILGDAQTLVKNELQNMVLQNTRNSVSVNGDIVTDQLQDVLKKLQALQKNTKSSITTQKFPKSNSVEGAATDQKYRIPEVSYSAPDYTTAKDDQVANPDEQTTSPIVPLSKQRKMAMLLLKNLRARAQPLISTFGVSKDLAKKFLKRAINRSGPHGLQQTAEPPVQPPNPFHLQYDDQEANEDIEVGNELVKDTEITRPYYNNPFSNAASIQAKKDILQQQQQQNHQLPQPPSFQTRLISSPIRFTQRLFSKLDRA